VRYLRQRVLRFAQADVFCLEASPSRFSFGINSTDSEIRRYSIGERLRMFELCALAANDHDEGVAVDALRCRLELSDGICEQMPHAEILHQARSYCDERELRFSRGCCDCDKRT
jgi:hypothetical protein